MATLPFYTVLAIALIATTLIICATRLIRFLLIRKAVNKAVEAEARRTAKSVEGYMKLQIADRVGDLLNGEDSTTKGI